MYKTVRHGDNSLQYTILPQQDDGGQGGGGLCRSGGRTRRRGRLPLVLVITLILAGSAVAAAILIPLLVTSDLVELPAALQRFSINRHPFVTHTPKPNTTTVSSSTTAEDNFNTLTTSTNYYNKTLDRKDDEDDDDEDDDNNNPSTKTPPQISSGFNEGVGGGVSSDNSTTKLSISTSPQPAATTDHVVDLTTLSTEAETVVNTQDGVGIPSMTSNSKILDALLPNTQNNTTNKTLAISEALAGPTSAPVDVTTKMILHSTPRTKTHSWWEPRWIFSDPSSYFQWTGYNRRDSLLLPLILGATLLVLILAVCICYTLRRRRQKKLRRQTIGKISSDLQCGDKATLLPDGSEEE